MYVDGCFYTKFECEEFYDYLNQYEKSQNHQKIEQFQQFEIKEAYAGEILEVQSFYEKFALDDKIN